MENYLRKVFGRSQAEADAIVADQNARSVLLAASTVMWESLTVMINEGEITPQQAKEFVS